MNTSFNNLPTWQALSHPVLAEMKPEDLFPENAEQYQCLHIDLWMRINRVNETIFTLEQLEQFPFDSIYAPNHMEFWNLVADNFGAMSIVLLHALLKDSGKDAHTLNKFRNIIAGWQWADQTMCNHFCETLRERIFDSQVNEFSEKISTIRHNSIAHRLVDEVSGFPTEHTRIKLHEVKEVFEAAHALFGALSFGTTYATLSGDLMPSTINGKPTRTCLDGVLDAVLRDSSFVNQPERRQQWWQVEREYISEEQLKAMNELRSRVGLPEA
jgi:hypothetical protein